MDVVGRFNAAWGSHDLDATLALVTEDFIFESTSPAPDGERHVGKDAARAAWKGIFDDPASRFTVEDGCLRQRLTAYPRAVTPVTGRMGVAFFSERKGPPRVPQLAHPAWRRTRG